VEEVGGTRRARPRWWPPTRAPLLPAVGRASSPSDVVLVHPGEKDGENRSGELDGVAVEGSGAAPPGIAPARELQDATGELEIDGGGWRRAPERGALQVDAAARAPGGDGRRRWEIELEADRVERSARGSGRAGNG
jgi:hypothetical protein